MPCLQRKPEELMGILACKASFAVIITAIFPVAIHVNGYPLNSSGLIEIGYV
jgi:hypothetical protein